MLEAIPTDLFSSNIRLQQKNELVGELDVSLFREQARVELGDGTYTMRREGLWSGDFLLERNGKVIASATKPSAFDSRFEVDLPSRHLTLRKPSVFYRRFDVFEGEKPIGSVYPLGVFTRHSNIDLPADLPLATRVFVFWLAFVIWKRKNAAAAS